MLRFIVLAGLALSLALAPLMNVHATSRGGSYRPHVTSYSRPLLAPDKGFVWMWLMPNGRECTARELVTKGSGCTKTKIEQLAQ
ncbi:hypothetical protein F1188_16200 [Roseospira marina]|uniref:Uncharacterized protein n=1 Tax=Roseospira marina TaxID=140057 RepID=A0A5M6I888_9PROT|nr:hypothetical protein [Roseospira marina]KAA5604401.1 hypothetical protein F1188_16200 [Roseospira marina]MBB4315407.1 hypothetical protein [Roseospira marina]MBB5088448.1 hypothetical protein [Roseospira marina]